MTCGTVCLAVSVLLAISLGAANIPLVTVWRTILFHDPANAQSIVIHDVRLPRVVVAAMVGACFAMAGAIMQGMTRNPLASPSLMGLNAGSRFAIVLMLAFVPSVTFTWLIMASFTGAALGAGIVFGVGSAARGGLSPVKLALAGVAVSALLGSLSVGIEIYFNLSENLLFFFSGGVAGVSWEQVQLLAPWFALGFCGAMALAPSITVMSLGDEMARGLGQRIVLVKAAGSGVVILLAGAAVWIGGAIGFIGLIVPHITRSFVGLDYRWIIPCSAVLGALMLVLADFGARIVNPPYELPVSVVTAMVGVPFFLVLARRDRTGL
jgi:iron complex transport system permease protein